MGGAPIVASSKYARNAVHACYEAMGGDQAFAEWARENPTEFYTKMFTKTIQKDHSISTEKTPEEIFSEIPDDVIDGDFELLESEVDDADYYDIDEQEVYDFGG